LQGANDIPIFFWLPLAFVAYVWISHAIVTSKRKRQLPELAKRLNLNQWGDDSLPGDLYLDGTEIAPVTRTFNVFEGTSNGVPVAIFDVSRRAGKGTSYFTVIAARGPDPFGAEAFDPDLTTTRSGEWTLLYRPREMFSFASRLLPVQQIEDQLRSIRRP
jgi:hypothetical protein